MSRCGKDLIHTKRQKMIDFHRYDTCMDVGARLCTHAEVTAGGAAHSAPCELHRFLPVWTSEAGVQPAGLVRDPPCANRYFGVHEIGL